MFHDQKVSLYDKNATTTYSADQPTASFKGVG